MVDNLSCDNLSNIYQSTVCMQSSYAFYLFYGASISVKSQDFLIGSQLNGHHALYDLANVDGPFVHHGGSRWNFCEITPHQVKPVGTMFINTFRLAVFRIFLTRCVSSTLCCVSFASRNFSMTETQKHEASATA